MLFLNVPSLFAQNLSLSLTGGTSLSFPQTNSLYQNQSVEPNLGFIVGVGSEYQINRHWAVGLDATLLSARHSVIHSTPNIQTQYANLFFEIPIRAKYYVLKETKRIRPYILAGLSSNFLLSSNYNGIYPNVFEIDLNEESGSESFRLERTSGSDRSSYRAHFFSLYTGLGVLLWSRKTYHLGLEARYSHGLQNFLASSNTNQSFYNRFLSVGVQLQFGL